MWIILLLLVTIASANSLCTFSDILNNNVSCLPSASEDGAHITLPQFELQLGLNKDTDPGDEFTLGIRYALEYYLNYTLAQDDATGFDDGGFAYATVERVDLIQPDVLQEQLIWAFEVTAEVYYNPSPGGWVFTEYPTAAEVLDRVQSVVEEPLDDGLEGLKFCKVMEKLLYEDFGLDAFQKVPVIALYEGSLQTASPSLRPTLQSTTLEPTAMATTLAPSATPTIIANEPTEEPTIFLVTSAPLSKQTPAPVLVADQPTYITIAPSMKVETSTPTAPVTSEPTIQMIPPTLWPTFVDSSKTRLPTIDSNFASSVDDSSSPTNVDEDGQMPKTTPPPTLTSDGNKTEAINTSSSTEQNDEFDKAKIDPATTYGNHSTIIASAALAGVFLVLITVSGAYFVLRHSNRKRGSMKESKDFPLHTQSDNDWNGTLSDVKLPIVTTQTSSQEGCAGQNNDILNKSADSSKELDDLVNQRQHSPLSPAIQFNANDKSALSTSTDTSSYDPSYIIGEYDEEKMAKKESARELFVIKDEESLTLDFFDDSDFRQKDVRLPNASAQPSFAVDDTVDESNARNEKNNMSNRLLKYSKPDAPSHPINQISFQPLIDTANIISPSSLRDRRSSLDPQDHYNSDPPENDITVVTDDGSNIEEEELSFHCPELNFCWNEEIVGYTDNNSWKRFTDCAPTSLKDFVSPMRHEDESFEANETAATEDDKWLKNALCENEWDFNDNTEVAAAQQEFVVIRKS